MKATTLHRAWRSPESWKRFRTGVSLHSHTFHSRERFGRLEWRPTLTPEEALRLERGQIEDELQRPALVSLTDHDTIEAPLRLRVLSESRHVPVSVEWTVPYREAELHLGLHNLPPRKARDRMAELARYTQNPRTDDLVGLLQWLVEDPETLVVFNHPCWDERRIGVPLHQRRVAEFLRENASRVHAMELNGLRPWTENQRTLDLAANWSLPVISGGDRHTSEANAMLNLSTAATFSEFVEEVREFGRSEVLVMPQYRRPRALRIARMVAEVVHQQGRNVYGDNGRNGETLAAFPVPFHPSGRVQTDS